MNYDYQEKNKDAFDALLKSHLHLEKRLKNDEEKLKRRISELTILNNTSTSLSSTIDIDQAIEMFNKALTQALDFDISSTLILYPKQSGKIITLLNTSFSLSTLKKIHTNLLKACFPFTNSPLALESIHVTTIENYGKKKAKKTSTSFESYTNIPLVFKDTIIGIVNLCSTKKNRFSKNQIHFIQTICNQLSLNLGRIQTIKSQEKSKILSLMTSMTDAVIMLDKNHQLEISNPAADVIFNKIASKNHSVLEKLREIHLFDHYKKIMNSEAKSLHARISISDKTYSVNISPVKNIEKKQIGTAFVFRNITELEQLDRIKTHRLQAIGKINLVIQSIHNLDQLLGVLMECINDLSHSDMGSIQLEHLGHFYTKIHSNFPDKIRKKIMLSSGEPVSDSVIRTKKACLLENFHSNPKCNPKTPILIESYLCIPILVQNQLIGIVNIIRRLNTAFPKLSKDDIKTLSTIANLSGTAIQNSILIKKSLDQEKLSRELKIANEIQSNLLPKSAPDCKKFMFAAKSFPAQDMGGDYFDFLELESGHIGLIIADIIGKGIPAGLFMGMLKGILHNHILDINSPKEALKKINKILCKDPILNKFVPLYYCILSPEKNTLCYANAGHEPALLIQNNEAITLDTPGLPLGAFEDTTYSENKIRLQDDALFFLYTDGTIDARNAHQDCFGHNRLKQFLKENQNLSPSLLIDKLNDTLVSFTNNKKQHDDITILAFKPAKQSNSIGNVSINKHHFKVLSTLESVKKVRQEIDLFCKNAGFSPEEIFDIKLAINEAHNNIIEHAYFGSKKGVILFTLEEFESHLRITIKDFGKNNDQKSIKTKKKDLKQLEGSGLGALLIRTLMSDVKQIQKEGSTELILIKNKKTVNLNRE